MNTRPIHPDDADPQLSALLDDALNAQSIPGGVPDDLAARTFARVRPELERTQRHVVGRIGPMQAGLWAAATAAVIAMAVGGAMWVGNFPDRLSSSAMVALDSQVIEDEIEVLALEIDSLRAANPWQTAYDSLDRDLAEWELSNTDLVTHF